MRLLLTFVLISTILLDGTNGMTLRSTQHRKPRVINGEPASLGQFPWQVIMYCNDLYGAWRCGGTIIGEEWILTAARCISRFIGCTVYAGLVDLKNLENSTSRMGWDVYVHAGYNDQTLANDIGLVHLDEPLEFSDNIRAIDLASDQLGANIDILVSGWGLISDVPSTVDILNYGTLTTIDNSNCNAIYGEGTIFEETVCAVPSGNVNQAICFGDIGGPAIIYDGDSPIVAAVSSFISDRGCESADPSGFIRVTYYRDWIRNITGF